jgi:hypothetical protein
MNGLTLRQNPTVVILTPERAMELLELNTHNRPLNDQHVKRLAKQIIEGKWKFNGDTIKISDDHKVLDGQHRLWAIVEAKTPVETILVRGIERDAFATIDTLRKPRSGSDVLALNGATRYLKYTSAALQWLARWQRGTIEAYRAPINRIENSDIEKMWEDNPGIERAIERVTKLRPVASPSLLGFFYFILSNRSPELAERMVHTLENPAQVGMNDPFFRLRIYLTSENNKHKDPVVVIAMMVKAANAAFHGNEIRSLQWRNQGNNPEKLPKLEVLSSGTAI